MTNVTKTECPRCGNGFMPLMPNDKSRCSKCGLEMTPQEFEEFAKVDRDDYCGECGKVGGGDALGCTALCDSTKGKRLRAECCSECNQEVH